MRSSRSMFVLVVAVALPSLVAGVPAAETDESSEEGTCWVFDDAGTPEDPTDDTELCELETWFHRPDTPVGNAEGVLLEQFPSWDTNPPAGSVAEGNGGGYMGNSVLDLAAPGDPSNAATFTGTYTGTLDNMAVSLYAWIPGRLAEGSNHHVHLMLEYNGTSVLNRENVEIVTTPDGDSTLRIDFVIEGLADLAEAFGAENGPETTHELTLKIGSWSFGRDEAIYLYDTTEVPSGIVFNRHPDTFGDYTVIPAF